MADAQEIDSQSDNPAERIAEARSQRRRKLVNVRVGNYLLCDYLGDGGVGTVYKSQQDNPRRFVAVKILSSGLLSESGPEEFLAEANRLGRLQHPNIAQIYEAGTHDEGPISLPFYSMELVRDGLPITAFVRKNKLERAQIIRRFLSVCDAVIHAHAQKIFHCDLKPGNILVDGEGTVKVIDFGIARAAEADQPGKTLTSATGIIRGTPQYMSPEQFTARDGAVTERSDVYSLGVVLYELLCGKLPYLVDKKDTLAAIRTVLQTAPTNPRIAKPDLGPGAEALLLKCLKKNPADRYQSVALLREDLQRLLEADSSVEALDRNRVAQSISWSKRWIGRHRLVAALVALPLVWLACALILPVWDAKTFVNRFEVFALTHFRHFPDAPLKDVQIVAITNEDLTNLARTLKVDHLDLSSVKAMRALHGALMQKLADAHCGVRAVVWDIHFSGASPFDDAFAAGVRALQESGVPVVIGGPWYPSENSNEAKPTSPVIARSGVQVGGLTANAGPNGPWQLDVALQRRNNSARPSIALLGAAAFWFGDLSHASFEINIEGLVARAESSSKDVGVSGLHAVVPEDHATDFGMQTNDVLAQSVFEIPGDRALAESTIDYAAVAGASDQQLHDWFANRVVLIGDARKGKDGPLGYPDGRALHGFTLNAVAIQRLLDDAPIRTVEMVSLLGARVTVAVIFAICAAIGGLLLGYLLAMRPIVRLGTELFIVVAMLFGALAAYSYAAKLHSPAVAIVVFVITCETLAAIRRTGRACANQNIFAY